MRAIIEGAQPRSTGPEDMPSMEEVGLAIQTRDKWAMLDLRDRFQNVDTFTASSAMHAVEGLKRLNAALAGPGHSGGPQNGRQRPVEDRVAEVRAAFAGQADDDLAVRRRAAEVRRQMEGGR